jgi:hypothetical protein
MPAGHATYEFAVLAMLLSAVLFFMIFPMTQGPFPVVDGPLANLVSIPARRFLFLEMGPVTIGLWRGRRLTDALTAAPAARPEVVSPRSVPRVKTTNLRC